MASTRLTMLDAMKRRSGSIIGQLIDDVRILAPEVKLMPVEIIDGTTFTTLRRTARPKGSFRKAHQGIDPSKSKFELTLAQAYLFSNRIEIDKAIALTNGGVEQAMSDETAAMLESNILSIGTQLFYGNKEGGDSLGFPGLQSQVNSALVVDAAGTTNNTATSVYGVKLGYNDVSFIAGGGSLFAMDPWRAESLSDANGKKFAGIVSDLNAWIGLRVKSSYSVGRIKNITDDSGKGLTDALAAKLLSKFPIGATPDYWVMNRRARYQLQLSRTVVLESSANAQVNGALGNVAPTPTEMLGIPIICTDSLIDTEPVA